MEDNFIVTVVLGYPFNELIKKDKLELNMKTPIQVKALVDLLIETYPDIARPLERNENGDISVLLLKESKILTINEVIDMNCSVKMLTPLSGG